MQFCGKILGGIVAWDNKYNNIFDTTSQKLNQPQFHGLLYEMFGNGDNVQCVIKESKGISQGQMYQNETVDWSYNFDFCLLNAL